MRRKGLQILITRCHLHDHKRFTWELYKSKGSRLDPLPIAEGARCYGSAHGAKQGAERFVSTIGTWRKIRIRFDLGKCRQCRRDWW